MPAQVKKISSAPVRALVVDDSALFRRLISDVLAADGRIDVVGTAADAYAARRLIKVLEPDVITLDVEMRGMDGLTFLRNLMRLRPMPVVMLSRYTQRMSEVVENALALGAVDCIAKPTVDVLTALEAQGDSLRERVIAASHCEVEHLAVDMRGRVAHLAEPEPARAGQIVAVGSSTGGTEAVREILAKAPPDGPAILIAQHIHAAFSSAFAARLDRVSSMTVKEAQDGEVLRLGYGYVAPGDKHLLLDRCMDRFLCRLSDDPPVNHHRPSVDVLFDSLADSVAGDTVAILLTGMGRDGAAGMLSLRELGAHTICQDESTSAVWGMPRAAAQLGAAAEILPLSEIGPAMLAATRRPAT